MDTKVITPQTPTPFDINENFKWLAGCLTFFLSYLYYVNLYFKNRAKDKQEFIIEVVKETVKATLESQLKDIREDIKILFKYRDDDRKHTDGQFIDLMKEIKKA